MNLDDAKFVLLEHQKLDRETQSQRADIKNEAFRVFLSSGPTEDEFSKYVGEIVLTAWKMR